MAEDDLYTTFDPPPAQPQWGASSNPFAIPASGSNPLLQPTSKWGGGTQFGAGGVPPSQMGGRGGGGGDARPMTSNRASGFNSAGGVGGTFDPTGQGAARVALGPAPPLHSRGDNSPEEQCNELERLVNTLIEESAMCAMQGDFGAALEKAKEAGKRERYLCKQREQLALGDHINADLTYAVHFNLAVQYQRHQLFTEALNTYSLIVRNMQYPQSGRLRVNMGNIYAEQKKYLLAIKMYRTTLEDSPTAGKEVRFRITRNIGNAFVRMGQYKDAVGSYESVMEGSPDIVTGFNLLLCYYALGEVERLKRTFGRLLSLKGLGIDEDEDERDEKPDVLVDDALNSEIKERRQQFLYYVTTAARLIAPVLDRDWRAGYDYVIEQLRHFELKDTSSRLASELEMCKALNYLKYKKYKEAIDGLKSFEKKDRSLRAKAATNLAYLYFMEGDFDSGEKYGDLSIESDRYNAKALVNKGNFLYMKGEYDRSRQYYNDALTVEVDNVEAMYNLGLVTKQLGLYDESLRLFKRLMSLVDSVEVLYQVADITDYIGDPTASEWFQRLIGRVPTDPNVLARLGLLHAKEHDESQAFHYYLEAYRYFQVNMDVISWLGAYFVHNEVYDKAMQFFERAAQIQPHEVKWQLMIASCHRRRGEYAAAKRLYEAIHRKYPDNSECLRFLVTLCKDAGLIEEANEWLKRFKRVEMKMQGDTPAPMFAAAAAAEEDSKPTTPVVERRSDSPVRGRRGKAEDDDDDVALPGV